ncbi:MAG TPA: beta-ketoacyl-ACP synthase II [Bacteroidaceae bacterium]|nr:beta-ketoacyl-ACP synthase II [Bacteroidaceae bacterium]
MSKRVVITGMGIISPIGNSISTYWNNLKNGVCGIDTITAFKEYDLPVKIAGQIKEFNGANWGIDNATARKADRYSLLTYAAAAQAMEESGLIAGDNIDPDKLGVYIGSGIGGMTTFVNESKKLFDEGVRRISPLFIPMMISNMASGNIAIKYNAQGPCLPIVTACATGTHSIGEAFRAISHGYAEAIITGGSEAAINPLSIGGFNNSRALSRSEDPKRASLPFHKDREGFVIAEGSGILVLEEYERAVKRGAKIYAEVCGYGNTCDAYHYTAPRPDGSTAAKALSISLKEAGFNDSDTLHINAHGTGTPLNDKSETIAIKIAIGEQAAKKSIICSTKSMTGHMLGAAGGAECIATVLALKNGIIPPTIGLDNIDPECDLDYTPLVARKANITIAISNSLGFGGHNGCIAIRKLK